MVVVTSVWQVVVTLLGLVLLPQPAAALPQPAAATLRTNRTGPQDSTTSGHRFSQAHFRFSLDLYGALVNRSRQPNANMLFSPVGVAALLSPLLHAHNPLLTQQIRQVLRYSNMTREEIDDGHRTMVENFADAYYKNDLRLAYRMFLQEGSSWAESAPDLYPPTTTQEVNFHNNGTEVLRGINRWVTEVTTVDVGAPLMQTPTVQVDALGALRVYYSGRWLHRFDPNLTFDKGLFYITSEERFEIPMMVGRVQVPLGYSAELEVRVLELPYAARRVSMFLLLPDHADHGLAALEHNITPDNIKALLSTLKEERVNVRVPRFRVDVVPPLQDALVSLGLTALFPPPLDDHPTLLLHDILHRAVCEVVERGEDWTAPSASGGHQVGTFGDKYFEVDHPFIFFVWDYIGSAVVLMGRVVTPVPILLPMDN
ncbi:leukocyte elastase inhibitor [Procambarus clarkii]|uniref:leukocyte elastase inhibitor n=1 Tax=Procambarus clarkii TaxID=6728 RepID=UPI003742E525